MRPGIVRSNCVIGAPRLLLKVYLIVASDSISSGGEESFRVAVSVSVSPLPPLPRREREEATATDGDRLKELDIDSVDVAPSLCCGLQTQSREVPLDVLCVLDKSGSMGSCNKLANLLLAGDESFSLRV